jgi:hypothetical protein
MPHRADCARTGRSRRRSGAGNWALRVYAKCIDGQDQIAKRRIEDALREPEDDAGGNDDDD